MKFLRVLATAAILLPIALAAEEATITVKKGDSTSIAIKPFAGAEGAAAAKVVQNDLELSSLFLLSPPERASFSVGATAGDGSLEGTVTDHAGSVVLRKSYSGSTRSAAHKFSDDIVETVTGNKGIASSKIAFSATRTGRKEIYTADYDGANVKQLTNDGNISVAPALSQMEFEERGANFSAGQIHKEDLVESALTQELWWQTPNVVGCGDYEHRLGFLLHPRQETTKHPARNSAISAAPRRWEPLFDFIDP